MVGKAVVYTAIVAVLMFVVSTCCGQDVLITKDADTIECRITSIGDELIHFQVDERDKPSKVPVEFLHKYLFRMEWEYVGELNQPNVKVSKPITEKQFVGNVRKAGFHLERAGAYQTMTPIFGMVGIGFGIGGGVLLAKNGDVGTGLIVASGVLGGAALISQFISGYHTRKAGNELRFVPVIE